MKAIFRTLIGFILVSGMLLIPCHAAEGYHWYCKHVKDHKRPSIPPELAFVEDLDAVFIDRSADDASDDKVVYLTFDAGYENGNIEKILNVLQEKDVRAAFFILANLIDKNPDLVRRMGDEGHTVCNHTAHHKDMSRLSDAEFLKELQALEAFYTEKTGKTLARFYRPPEGKFSRENLQCASENGYRTVFWSFAYPDWDNNRQMPHEAAKSMILDNAHNGAILLLHPTSKTNAEILGEVIDALSAQGYRFGTLDEIAPEKG